MRNEKRSPEQIREYFELLRWNKNGCAIDLSQEFIDSNELLLSIKKALVLSEESIIFTKNLIISTEGSIFSIIESISSTEQEISSVEESILLLRKARRAALGSKPTVEESVFSSKSSTIYKFSIKEICKQLLIEIYFGFKKTLSNLFKYLIKEPILASIIYMVILGIALFLNFIFSGLFKIILIVLLIVYIGQKINYIYEQQNQKWQKHCADIEVARKQKLKQELDSLRKAEQQEFEASLQVLEVRQNELIVRQQELKELKQQIEARLRAEQQELAEFEQVRQLKLEEYQQKLNELKINESSKKELMLKTLEEKVQRWLTNDIERLTNKAMKKLKITPPSVTGELNALQNEPIRVLIGIPEKTSESVIIESDSDLNLEVIENPQIYIDPKDFESEPSREGNNRQYGVYEFLIIFLCGNFLAYYKCYYNFIRGKTVDEEFCEYLYDSIVSLKIQEKSSLRLKDERQKNVYRKRLLITTKDGKIVCFRVAKYRIERTHSLRLSQIDQAAVAIRAMLRQRRIDFIRTENLMDG
ncbi:hypothetical protein NDI49_07780 [Trichocoleus sp. ST-U3]